MLPRDQLNELMVPILRGAMERQAMATRLTEVRRAERRLRLKRKAADALGLLVLFAVCAFFVALVSSGMAS